MSKISHNYFSSANVFNAIIINSVIITIIITITTVISSASLSSLSSSLSSFFYQLTIIVTFMVKY